MTEFIDPDRLDLLHNATLWPELHLPPVVPVLRWDLDPNSGKPVARWELALKHWLTGVDASKP